MLSNTRSANRRIKQSGIIGKKIPKDKLQKEQTVKSKGMNKSGSQSSMNKSKSSIKMRPSSVSKSHMFLSTLKTSNLTNTLVSTDKVDTRGIKGNKENRGISPATSQRSYQASARRKDPNKLRVGDAQNESKKSEVMKLSTSLKSISVSKKSALAESNEKKPFKAKNSRKENSLSRSLPKKSASNSRSHTSISKNRDEGVKEEKLRLEDFETLGRKSLPKLTGQQGSGEKKLSQTMPGGATIEFNISSPNKTRRCSDSEVKPSSQKKASDGKLVRASSPSKKVSEQMRAELNRKSMLVNHPQKKVKKQAPTSSKPVQSVVTKQGVPAKPEAPAKPLATKVAAKVSTTPAPAATGSKAMKKTPNKVMKPANAVPNQVSLVEEWAKKRPPLNPRKARTDRSFQSPSKTIPPAPPIYKILANPSIKKLIAELEASKQIPPPAPMIFKLIHPNHPAFKIPFPPPLDILKRSSPPKKKHMRILKSPLKNKELDNSLFCESSVTKVTQSIRSMDESTEIFHNIMKPSPKYHLLTNHRKKHPFAASSNYGGASKLGKKKPPAGSSKHDDSASSKLMNMSTTSIQSHKATSTAKPTAAFDFKKKQMTKK